VCTRCLGRGGVRPAPVAADSAAATRSASPPGRSCSASRASTSARSRPEGLDYWSSGSSRHRHRLAVSEPGATAPLLPADRWWPRPWLASRPSSVVRLALRGRYRAVEWPRRPDQGAVGVLAALWLPARLHLVAPPRRRLSRGTARLRRGLGWSGGAAGGPVSAEIAAAYFAAADVYVTASVADTRHPASGAREGAGRQPRCSDTAPEWCSPWRSLPRRRTIAASSPTRVRRAARNRASRVRSCGSGHPNEGRLRHTALRTRGDGRRRPGTPAR